MAHNRKLVLGAVSLVKGRIKNDLKVLDEVNDEVEPLLTESKFIEDAPFRWVGLIIRYGTKTVLRPEYQGINHVHGDLSVAVELEMRRLNTTAQSHFLRKSVCVSHRYPVFVVS